LGKPKGFFNRVLFFDSMGNVIWHIGVFSHGVSFFFALIFASQSVLKLFFHLLFFTASFDATKLFIVIYFFYIKSGRLFA
jgi:hypothetical protein